MWIWDYQLAKTWKPKTPKQWEWFLVRKINYGDFAGLTKKVIRKHFARIAPWLDPGKRAMLDYFLRNEKEDTTA